MCQVYRPVTWKMQPVGRKYLLRPENSGLIKYKEVIQPKFRGPPQLKSIKIQAKFYKIPAIRFEDQKLTYFLIYRIG